MQPNACVLGNAAASQGSMMPQLGGRPSDAASLGSPASMQLSMAPSSAVAAQPSLLPPIGQPPQPQQQPLSPNASAHGVGGSGRSRMRELLMSGAGAPGGGLFNGLRVRMGVVTGVVETGADSGGALATIMNSSLYKLALGECTSVLSAGCVAACVDVRAFVRAERRLAGG